VFEERTQRDVNPARNPGPWRLRHHLAVRPPVRKRNHSSAGELFGIRKKGELYQWDRTQKSAAAACGGIR